MQWKSYIQSLLCILTQWHQIHCLKNLQVKAKIDTVIKKGRVMYATYTENTVSRGKNSSETRVLGKSLHGNRTIHCKKCMGTIHCKKCSNNAWFEHSWRIRFKNLAWSFAPIFYILIKYSIYTAYRPDKYIVLYIVHCTMYCTNVHM